MRTTISLEDGLGEAARARAAANGLSLSSFVAEALRAALANSDAAPAIPPFRLVTAAGKVRPGIDLNRTSQIIADEDIGEA